MSAIFSKKTRLDVWNKTKGICWYCGKQTHLSYTGQNKDAFCVDHVIPRNICISLTDKSNLVPCCHSCNSIKRQKTLEAFRALLAEKHHGIPRFTVVQIAYLHSQGIDIPSVFPNYSHIQFWFEKQGLQIGGAA
jgi:hypothetical protein